MGTYNKMAEFPNEILAYGSQWDQFNLSNQLKHVVSTSSNLFFPVLLWRKEITYKCIFNALLTQLWLPLIEKKVDICYIHHSYCIFFRLQCGFQKSIENKIVLFNDFLSCYYSNLPFHSRNYNSNLMGNLNIHLT